MEVNLRGPEPAEPTDDSLAIVVAYQGMIISQLEKKIAGLESHVQALQSNLVNMAKGVDGNFAAFRDRLVDLEKRIQAVAENRVTAAGTVEVAPGEDAEIVVGAAIRGAIEPSQQAAN